jgi:hypothetical protein
MDPVSCVSYVSWVYCVYAAETHETFRQESGMRYQVSSSPDSEHELVLLTASVPSLVPSMAGSNLRALDLKTKAHDGPSLFVDRPFQTIRAVDR